MPDPEYSLALIAARIAHCAETLSEISASLFEVKRIELSEEALDTAIETAKLHYHVVELLVNPRKPPAKKEPTDPDQEELPF